MADEELRAIIQRCQILDEEDFKGEDFNLFQVAGQKCLDEGYIAEILEVVQNEKNVELKTRRRRVQPKALPKQNSGPKTANRQRRFHPGKAGGQKAGLCTRRTLEMIG